MVADNRNPEDLDRLSKEHDALKKAKGNKIPEKFKIPDKKVKDVKLLSTPHNYILSKKQENSRSKKMLPVPVDCIFISYEGEKEKKQNDKITSAK